MKIWNFFENIWIQPASGDAGGALGAALSVWHLHYNNNRNILRERDSMKGSYLGPEFNDHEIETEMNLCGAKYEKFKDEKLIEKVAS